jgi:hypothetical protein
VQTPSQHDAERDEEALIYIHEDDWGMRNLYPLAVQAEITEDLNDAVASAERHRDPAGLGWTAVHVIREPSTSYVDAGLLVADAAAAIDQIMPRVKRFYATIFSAIGQTDRDPLGLYNDDAWCFGFDRHCYLKLDVEGELVRAIWFDFSSDSSEHADALRQSMEEIERLVPSFIADYFMEAEVPLSDTELLDRYFAHLRG